MIYGGAGNAWALKSPLEFMPLSLQLVAPPNIETEDIPTAFAKATLLVVDDEEGPRLSLKVIFGDAYNILLAEDGPTAIKLIREQHVDVAVLDIRMGGMSGIEVLERLRFIDPNIEVVMMTAFETTDTIRQALRLRACDYINKPFDIATMRSAVAGALERRSLASELRNNTEKLGDLQKDLQQVKMDEKIVRTRGEIYASIIHDINGPLTIISGLLQIINQRIGDRNHVEGDDLDLVKDRLKRITRQVTNCIEISRRYLGFLRPIGNETAPVWINQILGDLGELLSVHPGAKNNQLLIHPLPEDATVGINGTDLLQILLNLTLNALQCTPQYHRVELRGQLILHPLDLGMFVDGSEDRFINREGFNNAAPLLALSVQDNGPGIAHDIMPKIFEPYFTTQTKSQGTGLGLCIVQRLLKEARGGLHTHSKLGQGTVFTVYLSVATATANAGLKLEN
jgi:two-component system sensor histidine kinase/response regulator